MSNLFMQFNVESFHYQVCQWIHHASSILVESRKRDSLQSICANFPTIRLSGNEKSMTLTSTKIRFRIPSRCQPTTAPPEYGVVTMPHADVPTLVIIAAIA